MGVTELSKNKILSFLFAISLVVFSFRGKYGGILIGLILIIEFLFLLKEKKLRLKLCFENIWVLFVLIFAVISNAIRTINFEYYLQLGYLLAVVVLLNLDLNKFEDFFKYVKFISIFEAFSIYLQKFLPSIYYSIISIILPDDVVFQITKRFSEGYLTGFSREVSYTMFLISIGIGMYWFNCTFNNTTTTKKNVVPILFLFGALILSGKRATLLFSIISLFITSFIVSRDKLKIIKYSMIFIILFMIVIFTYDFWSKIPSLQRIVELLSFIKDNDFIGITNGRTIIYETAINLWNTNPLTGIGWGNFKYAVPSSLWFSGFDVHNCFLQVFCETGYIGGILYIILIIGSLIKVVTCNYKFRNEKSDIRSLTKFLCYVEFYFVLYSITEPILYEYTDYIIFFICINTTSLLLLNRRTGKFNINNSRLLLNFKGKENQIEKIIS